MGEGSRHTEGISGEGIENDRLDSYLAAESRACRVCQSIQDQQISEKSIELQRSRLQDRFHSTPAYQVTSIGSGFQEGFS